MVVRLWGISEFWMLANDSLNRGPRRVVRGVTEGIPIDRGNPAILPSIELNDTIGPKLVRAAFIIGVIGVQSEDETLFEADSLKGQVTVRPGAGEAQPVRIVEIMEIRIDAWMSHRCAPLIAHRGRLLGFLTVGWNSRLACSGVNPPNCAS
jgi:hypothetical protein